MITDQQIRRLFTLMQQKHTLATAAAMAGMDEKTARRYRRLGKLPSDLGPPHTWRTREDPFHEVWPEICQHLATNPGLEAKALFAHLKRQYPGRFSDGQLRTFQRRVKRWRALEGPPREVYFEQEYTPGERAQSDFTSMNSLKVTLAGAPFDHLIYHFVLPYSNPPHLGGVEKPARSVFQRASRRSATGCRTRCSNSAACRGSITPTR